MFDIEARFAVGAIGAIAVERPNGFPAGDFDVAGVIAVQGQVAGDVVENDAGDTLTGHLRNDLWSARRSDVIVIAGALGS